MEKPGSVDFTNFSTVFSPFEGCKNIITDVPSFENIPARNNAALERYKWRYWYDRKTRKKSVKSRASAVVTHEYVTLFVRLHTLNISR